MNNDLDPRLIEVLKMPGNELCADCHEPDPDWASVNLGIVFCIKCAGCHRSLGSHISQVKSITLDAWKESHLTELRKIGNTQHRGYWEATIPIGADRPTNDHPDFYRQQWIRAKYVRMEFCTQKTRLEAQNKNRNIDFSDKSLHASLSSGMAFDDDDDDDAALAAAAADISDDDFSDDDEEPSETSPSPDTKTSPPKPPVSAKPGNKPSESSTPDDLHPTPSGALYSGWLSKQSPHNRNWKNRWFVLTSKYLAYYKEPYSTFPLGVVPLIEASLLLPRRPEEMIQGSFSKQIYCFQILTPSRNFILNAPKDREMFEWAVRIKAAIYHRQQLASMSRRPDFKVEQYSGTVEKQGGSWKSWKSRFLILRSDATLVYYKDEDALKNSLPPQGDLDLEEVFEVVSTLSGPEAKKFSSKPNTFALKTSKRTFFFCVAEAAEKEAWISHISNALAKIQNPSSASTTPSSSAVSAASSSQKVLKQGYLSKRGLKVKNWKNRYFVLLERGSNVVQGINGRSRAVSISEGGSKKPQSKSKFKSMFKKRLNPNKLAAARSAGGVTDDWHESGIILAYYKTQGSSKPAGIIPINDQVSIGPAPPDLEIPEIMPQYAIELKVPGRAFYLAADEQSDIESWETFLNQAIQRSAAFNPGQYTETKTLRPTKGSEEDEDSPISDTPALSKSSSPKTTQIIDNDDDDEELVSTA